MAKEITWITASLGALQGSDIFGKPTVRLVNYSNDLDIMLDQEEMGRLKKFLSGLYDTGHKNKRNCK